MVCRDGLQCDPVVSMVLIGIDVKGLRMLGEETTRRNGRSSIHFMESK